MKIVSSVPTVWLLLVCTVGAATSSSRAPLSGRERAQGFADQVVLAKPRPELRERLEAAESRARVRLREHFERLGGLRVVEIEPGESVSAAVARLQATGLYEFVEPDYLLQPDGIPNDLSFSFQWSLNNTGQLSGSTPGADIRAVSAWETIREAPNVIVAIVDNGIRVDHQDLAPNLWVNPSPTFGDVNGASIIRGVRSGAINDDTGHGTHVAGIICARGDNGIAIAGVAWRAKLMVLKNAGPDGISASSDSAACIDYAVAHGAKIINCSFGGSSYSQTLFTAIRAARDAGVIVVTSAGNSGLSNDLSPHYPSNYMLDNVVAVGNSGPTDAASSSSDYGASVDLFAPGTAILSLDYTNPAGTISKSGTSMAAPHVTGALALMRAQFPSDSYRELINRLLRSADIKLALAGRAQTNARLNLLRAVTGTSNRPFNDDFANRAVIGGSTLSLRSNNRGATTESGEPSIAGATTTGTLWWLWVATATGDTVVDTTGSDYDTVLGVYGGSASTFSALSSIASNDDASGMKTSRLTFRAVYGNAYVIGVGGKAGAEGFTQLNIAPAAANDNFADATPLSGESTQATGRNNSATLESGEPRILGNAGGGSLWYKWTAPRAGNFYVSVFSYDFDTLLAIYTGSGLGNLTLVTANDNTDPTATIANSDSRCALTAVAGTTYYFQVDTKNSVSRGAIILSVTDSLWQLSASADVTGSPAIAPDGTIYFGSISPDRRLYAVNPDGSVKWTFAVGGSIDVATPAIGADGTLYFGSADGKFTALRSDGTSLWQRDFGGALADISYSPALASDGTIYVHCDDGYLYALNPTDGTTKWRYNVNAKATYSSAVVAPDGTIYQGSDDKNLYALNPDGTLKWKFDGGGDFLATPALDAAGNIYCATYSNSRVVSLTPTGATRWTYTGVTDTNAISGSPTLSADGATVYIGAADRKLHAIDAANGAARWTYTTGSYILACTPAVDSSGVIYIGSYDGKLYAINSSGTLKRTWDTALPIRSSPAIFGTTLYVGSRDAKLYAFDIGAYAGTGPWPMYRHNVRRLGRSVTEPPYLGVAPQTRTATAGEKVALSVTATGQGPLGYQWSKDGAAIAGATSATFSIPSFAAADIGSYAVTVTGSRGSVTSAAASLTATVINPGRLVNLSILTDVTSENPLFTVGAVVGGAGTTGTKPLLIRAAGPSLAQLGVSTALSDPKLELFSGQTRTDSNDDWGGGPSLSAAFAQVGAFAFASTTSKDAAIYKPTFASGGFTVQVSGVAGASGTVIAELYDSTAGNTFTAFTPRLVNVSVLKQIGAGNSLTAGFVIGGSTSKQVLIRAVGPTLGAAPFNVPGVNADPKLELFRGQTIIDSSDNWGGSVLIATAAANVGAFALLPAGKDAALLVTLQPGSYTAQVTGVDGASGLTLVEVYEVP